LGGVVVVATPGVNLFIPFGFFDPNSKQPLQKNRIRIITINNTGKNKYFFSLVLSSSLLFYFFIFYFFFKQI
jgi:hypothetical protein